MRILHVITTMDRGGAENHVAALARLQAQSGHEIRIVYLTGTGEAVPDDVAAKRLAVRDWQTWAKARRWAGRNGVVHAHLPRAELAATRLLSGPAPIIISRHNTEPFWDVPCRAASRWLSLRTAARADTVIAISEAVESYHRESGHVAPDTRVAVIPYGYEPRHGVPPDESRWVPRRGQSHGLKIACVARLAAQKDLPTLLRATALLRDTGLDVDLRIAGDGPDKGGLAHLVEQLQLSDHVSLVGRIANPEGFIAGADIFALPSKYEGLGLVLLEAMGVGTPIVAARNTAIAEVVVDEESGLLFRTGDPTDLASQIRRLALDPGLRTTLSAAGAQRLRSHYSVDRMLQQTTSVYERALERAT